MKTSPVLALAAGVCVLLAAPAKAVAAPDLTGLTVAVDYLYPDASTVLSHDNVVVGAGSEIVCPNASTNLCTMAYDPQANVSVDLSSDTITFSQLQQSTYQITTFNGFRFSGLAAGGPWTGFTLDTNFTGLTTSDISFLAGNILLVNLSGITSPEGEAAGFLSVTLQSQGTVPEPASLLLLGLGLAPVARRLRRRGTGRT